MSIVTVVDISVIFAAIQVIPPTGWEFLTGSKERAIAYMGHRYD